MNKQLGGCQANQGRLEQDLENKDVALDIDHTCHNIHNNSKDIQLHGGIERQVMKYSVQNIKRQKKIDNLQVKGAEPTAWERKSDKNLQDSQKARAKSERLRAEVEHCRQLYYQSSPSSFLTIINTITIITVIRWSTISPARQMRC